MKISNCIRYDTYDFSFFSDVKGLTCTGEIAFWQALHDEPKVLEGEAGLLQKTKNSINQPLTKLKLFPPSLPLIYSLRCPTCPPNINSLSKYPWQHIKMEGPFSTNPGNI